MGRIIFLVLIVFNIIIAAMFYGEIQRFFSTSDVPVKHAEKEKKQVHIPAGQQVNKITTAQQQCVEVHGFGDAKEALELKKWLLAQNIFARQRTRLVVTEQQYRVYVNNFTTEHQARQGLDILKNRHRAFEASFVYRYSPEDWRIALNTFSNKDNANGYTAELQSEVGGVDFEMETKTKNTRTIYLTVTQAAAVRFLDEYQNNPQWKTRLGKQLFVEQCKSG